MLSKSHYSLQPARRLLRHVLPLSAAMLLGTALLSGCKSDDHIPITGALLDSNAPAAAPADSCCSGAAAAPQRG